MKRILGYLKPLLGRMLTGFGIKLAGTVMDLAIPWILAHIIDDTEMAHSEPNPVVMP